MTITVGKEKKKHDCVCGRAYGKELRKKYNMDALDRNGEQHIVEFTDPANQEFLVGFFGSTFRMAKEFEGFEKRYKVKNAKGCKGGPTKVQLQDAFDFVMRDRRGVS
jgi:hypothetical protein